MKYDFTYYNPTKIHFGKGAISHLPEELAGIKSNPSYSQVLEGAKLVKENEVDLILAVGGGSVIDCAKAISLSAYATGDPWQRYWIDFEEVDNKIVPVGTILTMAGTASEMNSGSVITNEAVTIKTGRVYPLLCKS